MTPKLVSYMRPFITVAFVGMTIGLTVVGKVDPREILTVTGMLVSFWFGERSALKNKDEEN